ncbi:hypothetical protein [Aeromicrobium sp.]|uniref:hypothetical protein n=1 Tax=Aeromicrobium sp. TaxID=1871063 RepID=UPI003C328F55
MNVISRMVMGSLGVVAAGVLAAGPASAHECVNASKNPAAGVQIVFNQYDEVVYVSKGLQSRFDRGLVDPNTGDGFHGLVGFDMDGDNVADISIYITGPESELPHQAQVNGPPCRGVTNIQTYFEQCVSF